MGRRPTVSEVVEWAGDDVMEASDEELARAAGLEGYVPRTPLGREVLAIRVRIVASGQPLLDWEGLEREIAERRGGVYRNGES